MVSARGSVADQRISGPVMVQDMDPAMAALPAMARTMVLVVAQAWGWADPDEGAVSVLHAGHVMVPEVGTRVTVVQDMPVARPRPLRARRLRDRRPRHPRPNLSRNPRATCPGRVTVGVPMVRDRVEPASGPVPTVAIPVIEI